MSFLHPLCMLAFFYVLYLQRSLGLQILQLKERSPEFDKRPKYLESHVNYAYILLAIIVIGMFGGILGTVYALSAPAPFLHTYGHGFLGVLALACLVVIMIMGFNIKHVVRPKVRDRFFSFHMNLVYVIAGFGVFSFVTGLLILAKGISV